MEHPDCLLDNLVWQEADDSVDELILFDQADVKDVLNEAQEHDSLDFDLLAVFVYLDFRHLVGASQEK